MRIRWTEPASRDLTGICDYTQEHHGPEPARKLASRIYEAIGSLLQFPHLVRLGRKPGTRELVLPGSPFLAVYRIRKDVIEIARILHGAQQWP
ncbi:MAG: type II toxin-antitoxin system RelE/ParE family toxin [Terriglobales bacterium]|jgi:toxin ParE1/3/4